MLKPDIKVASVSEITAELLRENGITAVMVDLDDTLVPSGANSMAPSARQWMAGLRQAGVPVLILSNGERQRVARWAQELAVPAYALAGKPLWFAFRRGLRRLGTKPAQTAMIGDQLFTDVLGANLTGVRSILVQPLSPGKLPHTRLLRSLERRILKSGTQQEQFLTGGQRGNSVDR